MRVTLVTRQALVMCKKSLPVEGMDEQMQNQANEER